MASTSLSLSQQAFKLGSELHRIRARRFTWVREQSDEILQRCSDYARDHENWFQRADAVLSALRDEGQVDLADDLARKWLNRNIVTDPGNFKLQVPTGHGYERWEITASDKMQEDDSRRSEASYVPSKGGHVPTPAPEVLPSGLEEDEDELGALPRGGAAHGPAQLPTRLLALANPIDLRLSEAEVARWDTVTLDLVRQSKLWLSCTRSGTVFCLVCDCPEMTLPALRLDSSAPYELVTRHFHRDPFEGDAGLIHFLKVHREGYRGGVKDMLSKWARRVELSGGGQESVDKWTIAAHNLSVQAWYQQLYSEWRQVREQYRYGRAGRKRRASTLDTDRALPAALVSTIAYTFQWPKPGDDTWVVLCTHPDCEYPDFEKHPLRRDRALEHFRSHGVHMDSEQEVLQHFGFRVPDYGIKEETTDEEDEVTRDRSTRFDPASRPALINQRAEYYRFSYRSLRRECRLRGIPLADTRYPKASLEKKLKINDGLEDYDDQATWSAAKLQAECLRRGLRITGRKDNTAFTRPMLIKTLERHDTQLRQWAATETSATAVTTAGNNEIAHRPSKRSTSTPAASKKPIQQQSPRSKRTRITRSSTPAQRTKHSPGRPRRASSLVGSRAEPGSEDELDPLQSILEEDEEGM